MISAWQAPQTGERLVSVSWKALAAVAALTMVGCGGEDDVPPDGVWNLTISSNIVDDGAGGQQIDTTCNDAGQAFRTYSDSFKYELFYDGDAVHIDVDGQSFADGTRAGCNLLYESSVWLEDRAGGQVTWYVEAGASYRGSAGGCDNQLEAGVDWEGYETIIVVESEDESVPVGCEYNLVTSGTVVSGG
jgi:hypothetical protein